MPKVKIVSFSYRDQTAPAGAVVFDCRGIPNPHNHTALRSFNGKHKSVQDFVLRHNETHLLIGRAAAAIKAGATHIAFGCYGGKHRSVAVAELVAEGLCGANVENDVEHTNIR